VLHLVVLLESVVSGEDFGGDNKFVVGRIEWPEVGSEDHDAETNLHVVVILFHSALERVGEIFAETHI